MMLMTMKRGGFLKGLQRSPKSRDHCYIYDLVGVVRETMQPSHVSLCGCVPKPLRTTSSTSTNW